MLRDECVAVTHGSGPHGVYHLSVRCQTSIISQINTVVHCAELREVMNF